MSAELARLFTERKIRKFLVYDLEWYPGTYELRLIGVYDGRRYRAYQSMERFFYEELSSEHRGWWFFAHAGGIADIQFVYEKISVARTDISIRASLSGSSSIIVHLKKGKNAWHFVDSYRLMPVPLAKIGKWIGIEKGMQNSTYFCEKCNRRHTECLHVSEHNEYERECCLTCDLFEDHKFWAEWSELRDYNERDCIILWHAIDQFESSLLELGGTLKMTLASSAMELFRRRFLRQDIMVSQMLNDVASQAYIASRVEVFTKQCDDSNYYDVNSSFPFAMTFPVPGDLLYIDRKLPFDETDAAYEEPCLVHCEIEIPDSYLPPLPIRYKEKVYFPSGKWKTWLTGVDLVLALREGARILRVFEVMHFAPFDDLRGYAETVYNWRMSRAGDGNEFQAQVGKILLNALYGKFGESPEKDQLIMNPECGCNMHRVCDNHYHDVKSGKIEFLMPGVMVQTIFRPPAHAHVPISAWITSTARQTLYDYLCLCNSFHYCDTDGFSTEDTLMTTPEMGGLKLEKLLRGGEFYAPKLYHLWLAQAGKDGREHVFKAKGFTQKKMNVQKWMALLESQDFKKPAVEIVRMMRTKELMRLHKRGKTDNIKPRDITIMKRLRENQQPKRFFYPDGHSRPWDIGELK